MITQQEHKKALAKALEACRNRTIRSCQPVIAEGQRELATAILERDSALGRAEVAAKLLSDARVVVQLAAATANQAQRDRLVAALAAGELAKISAQQELAEVSCAPRLSPLNPPYKRIETYVLGPAHTRARTTPHPPPQLHLRVRACGCGGHGENLGSKGAR